MANVGVVIAVTVALKRSSFKTFSKHTTLLWLDNATCCKINCKEVNTAQSDIVIGLEWSSRSIDTVLSLHGSRSPVKNWQLLEAAETQPIKIDNHIVYVLPLVHS